VRENGPVRERKWASEKVTQKKGEHEPEREKVSQLDRERGIEPVSEGESEPIPEREKVRQGER